MRPGEWKSVAATEFGGKPSSSPSPSLRGPGRAERGRGKGDRAARDVARDAARDAARETERELAPYV